MVQKYVSEFSQSEFYAALIQIFVSTMLIQMNMHFHSREKSSKKIHKKVGRKSKK